MSVPDVSVWQVAATWVGSVVLAWLAVKALLWASEREEQGARERALRNFVTTVRTAPRRGVEADGLDD